MPPGLSYASDSSRRAKSILIVYLLIVLLRRQCYTSCPPKITRNICLSLSDTADDSSSTSVFFHGAAFVVGARPSSGQLLGGRRGDCELHVYSTYLYLLSIHSSQFLSFSSSEVRRIESSAKTRDIKFAMNIYIIILASMSSSQKRRFCQHKRY